ncbi:uncharacterized protein LOC119644322 [Glossina fuscipes]|uniref:Uncharacterized protein LOC119644322 n=1 Tax=Glossina fuscipes TaxID=7396 RepID=A0A9C5ZG22_9MUSC|nr:uncharacterized protein LOC119644322 [Glossina fuscipes]
MEQFHGVGNLNSIGQMILEKEENLDPQVIKSSMADGCVKKRKHNNSIEVSLPLRPIEVDAANKHSIHNGNRKLTLNNYESEDHTKLSANLHPSYNFIVGSDNVAGKSPIYPSLSTQYFMIARQLRSKKSRSGLPYITSRQRDIARLVSFPFWMKPNAWRTFDEPFYL